MLKKKKRDLEYHQLNCHSVTYFTFLKTGSSKRMREQGEWVSIVTSRNPYAITAAKESVMKVFLPDKCIFNVFVLVVIEYCRISALNETGSYENRQVLKFKFL
jgi:hypothetical protein